MIEIISNRIFSSGPRWILLIFGILKRHAIAVILAYDSSLSHTNTLNDARGTLWLNTGLSEVHEARGGFLKSRWD